MYLSPQTSMSMHIIENQDNGITYAFVSFFLRQQAPWQGGPDLQNRLVEL